MNSLSELHSVNMMMACYGLWCSVASRELFCTANDDDDDDDDDSLLDEVK